MMSKRQRREYAEHLFGSTFYTGIQLSMKELGEPLTFGVNATWIELTDAEMRAWFRAAVAARTGEMKGCGERAFAAFIESTRREGDWADLSLRGKACWTEAALRVRGARIPAWAA